MNYNISEPQDDLKTGVYWSTYPNTLAAFDDVLTDSVEGGSSSECNLGMAFKPKHIGLVSAIKWFMGDIADGDTTYLQDKLIFQGSMDNTTYTDIFKVDQNVHEGWNYKTWNSTEYQKYRFYRFHGDSKDLCKMNELKFTGVETIADTNPTYECDVKVITQGTENPVTNKVLFKNNLTPLLTSISPRYGTVTGGTKVTFTGTGFSSVTTENTVVIDGIPCVVDTASATAIECTTGKRPGLRTSNLDIKVANKGSVSLQHKVFRYVSFWTDPTTWGGEFAPMEMESVFVPQGLNLYVDVDRTDMLNAIIVEGSIIFAPHVDPNHQRTFDAHYIFVRNGTMEVGTEEFPYTSKITITMHSDLLDPYLPIYGNKVIGCRYCTLDMHGIRRSPVWSMLE